MAGDHRLREPLTVLCQWRNWMLRQVWLGTTRAGCINSSRKFQVCGGGLFITWSRAGPSAEGRLRVSKRGLAGLRAASLQSSQENGEAQVSFLQSFVPRCQCFKLLCLALPSATPRMNKPEAVPLSGWRHHLNFRLTGLPRADSSVPAVGLANGRCPLTASS